MSDYNGDWLEDEALRLLKLSYLRPNTVNKAMRGFPLAQKMLRRSVRRVVPMLRQAYPVEDERIKSAVLKAVAFIGRGYARRLR